MPEKARFATAHRIRFPQVATPETLDLSPRPAGALSWKIGPTGKVGSDGYRLPFLSSAIESWHALLLPVMHRGECNHLHRDHPDLIFDASPDDPGGRCMVITTAGFLFGPGLDINRFINFRRKVDIANTWIGQAEGCLASQVFTPHTVGDDGVTMSIWRDDASMLAAAYRPGEHRAQLDRHKTENLFDRSSFTRCRILESIGQWGARNIP